jgi:hypothetical protein
MLFEINKRKPVPLDDFEASFENNPLQLSLKV